MTKNEAADLHIVWMDGYYCGAKMKRTSIAQNIRDAAINWPVYYLGQVECGILDYAFNGTGEGFLHTKLRGDEYQARTFMLLVAEALE